MTAAGTAPLPCALFEDRHAAFGLSPRAWDFVLTCYEPLSMVTGGIGTYSRLLLRLLSREAGQREILLICAVEPDRRLRDLLPNIKIIVAPPILHRHGLHVEDVGDEHMRFSLAVAETFWALQKHGHSFRFIEFPDYGMEGYFSIKMRRHGQLRAERMAVRLHSPLLMLFEDNGDPLHIDSVGRRRSLAYELFCYRHADLLPYGAEAMRARIETICGRLGVDISARTRKIPHPKAEPGLFGLDEAPPPPPRPRPEDQPLTVCYVGRLENRKGIAAFFETVAASAELVGLIKERNLRFQLVGLDLPHDEKRSNGDLIRAAVAAAGLETHVEIFGYVDQQKLPEAFFAQADAFVFPSIFENYPNALLETLPYGRPTLVSARGGMPEVSAPFPEVVSYDPLAPEAPQAIYDFLAALRPADPDPRAREKFDEVARQSNANMLRAYFALAEAPAAPPAAEGPDFAVGFVVPHCNAAADLAECLASIQACAAEQDEIVVVDDASTPAEALLAKEIVAAADAAGKPTVQLIALERESGASAARNAGAAALAGSGALQFLDAGDTLDPEGFRATRAALRRNPDLDMAYGVQRVQGERNHFWFTTDANPMTAIDENFAHGDILVRKPVFDALGGYAQTPLDPYADWAFNARFCLAGFNGEAVTAPALNRRLRPDSPATADECTRARQNLLAHLARCEKVTGDPATDELVMAIACHASALVDNGLISGAAPKQPRATHVTREVSVRELRERIKGQKMPRWRKSAASLLLSLTKKLGGLEV